jgi:hypothetical protein
MENKICIQILIHKTSVDSGDKIPAYERKDTLEDMLQNLVISDSHSFYVQLATALDPLILRRQNGFRTRYPETFLYIQFSRIKKRQFGTLLHQKLLMSN